jgi:hypothetical protein
MAQLVDGHQNAQNQRKTGQRLSEMGNLVHRQLPSSNLILLRGKSCLAKQT